MKNKTMRNKWTKKLRAIIISLSVAFVVAMGGACAAIGLSMSDKNDRLGGGYIAGGVANETAQVNIGTEIEVTTLSDWESVIAAESSADSYVKATLKANLTANSTTHKFGETEGENEVAYTIEGALNVPEGKYIVLDLNGYTINRGLTEAVLGGSVIANKGSLVIRDTSAKGNGKITGGYDSNAASKVGGGISVRPEANLVLDSGNISGNKSEIGAGVFVYYGGTFTMNGGSITGNTATGSGAGVYVATNHGQNATFTMNGGTISKNVATQGNGGGIYVQAGIADAEVTKHVTIKGTAKITENTAGFNGLSDDSSRGRGGGIFVYNDVLLDIGGQAEISKNKCDGYAAGVYICGGTLNMTGGTISDNESKMDAGGMFVHSTVMTMTGGTISGNKATQDGGGIRVMSGATLTVKDGATITGNTAGRNGGGIIAQSFFNKVDANYTKQISTLNVEGGEISENKAGSHGGGIYTAGVVADVAAGAVVDGVTVAEAKTETTPCNLNITGGTISGNTSGAKGGGMHVGSGATVTIKNATFTNNAAVSMGGGMYYDLNTTVTLTGTRTDNEDSIQFIGNTSNNGGGINGDGSLIISYVTLDGNIATTDGGAINTYATIADHVTMKNNTAGKNAGAFRMGSTYLYTLTECTISNNTAGSNGGGIYSAAKGELNEDGTVKTYGLTINGGTISNNTANDNGGGICVESTATFKMTAGTISDNTAKTYGGAIRIIGGNNNVDLAGTRISGSGKTAVNSIIIRNNKALTKNGGAICSTSRLFTVSNTTFDDNSAVESGGAICAYGYTVTDSLFINNKADNAGAISTQDEYIADMTNCYFEGNSAVASGGAIGNLASAGVYNLTNCTVTNNESVGTGGGICISDEATATLNGVTVTGNTSGGLGGGVYFGAAATLKGKIDISGNFLKEPPGNLVKNNAYVAQDYAMQFNAAQITTGSTIGVNAISETQLYYGQKTYANVVNWSADNSLWKIDKSTSGDNTTVKLVRNLPSGVTATNESLWNYAAKNSSDENPIVVDLVRDWTWGLSSLTGFGSGDGFTTDGNLTVPKDKNIVLNLNGKTIDRAAGSSMDNTGYVISVSGTLTIIGTGTIKGGKPYVGGAIVVSSGGKLILSGGTISGNTAYNGGAVYVNTNGTMIMNGGEITGNTADYQYGRGGAIYVDSKGTFEMHGGKIWGNTATGWTGSGGAIYGMSANITIDGGSIYSNKAIGGAGSVPVGFTGCSTGGGLFLSGCTTTIGGNVQIYNNTTAGRGGIYMSGGTLTMTGGRIYGNSAGLSAADDGADGGGGVWVKDGTFTMEGGQIYDNTAATVDENNQVQGSDVYIATPSSGKSSIFNMKGGSISVNPNTTNIQVGVYVPTSANFNFEGGKITSSAVTGSTNKCRAIEVADGVVNMSGTAEITGFTGLSATRIDLGVFNMTGGSIHDNYTSNAQGSAVHVPGGLFVMSGGTIKNNTASNDCSGVYVYQEGAFEMSGNANISNNKTTKNGGAVYVSTGCLFTMKGGTISGNKATQDGGGVYVNGGVLNMTAGTIEKNSATNGGGVYINDATFTMTGGLIDKNSASNNGGGVYAKGESTFNLGKLEGTNKVGAGVISGNTATVNGGGVAVISSNTAAETDPKTLFNMYSGEVKNNLSANGGGVYMFGNVTVGLIAGGVSSGNIANAANDPVGGGLYVGYGATATMTGGVSTGNTAAEGGGLFVSQRSKVEMTGGEIYNNNVTLYGGGVAVYGSDTVYSEFIMSGTAKIYGNSSAYSGGGVYVYAGTKFTMSGGIIGGTTKEEANTALTSGGGVFVRGTFEMSGTAKISGNKAEHAGGVRVANGTFEMKGGEISGNTATGNGGGVYSGATFNMSGGIISGNTASNGGGVRFADSTTFEMSGGEISGNTALTFGGGVTWANDGSVFNLKGNVNITGNKLNETVCNVRPEGNSSVINVTGAINANSKIGVSVLNNEYRVFTSGFGNKSGLDHPNMVFTADDNKLIVGTNGSTGSAMEAKLAECLNINLTIYGMDGVSTGKTAIVKADKDTNVTYTVEKDKITFKSTQGGRANIETVINVTEVAGYTPYLYNNADNDAEVKSGEGVLAPLAADVDLRIGYKADTDTAYEVFYILQQPNGSYTDKTKPSELRGMNSVKVYTGHGTTDGPLAYKTGEGKALVPEGGWTDWADYAHYSFESVSVENPTVSGEGNSYVLVKLKLDEYTVTYTASGANPSLQTQTYKYGATLNDTGIQNPTKDMNEFAGWCFDADCTQEVKFDGSAAEKVSANIQLYAKFNTQHFKLIFNLNVGEGTNQLPTGNANKTILYPNAKGGSLNNGLLNGKVSWDTNALFPADEKFDFKAASEGEGKFVIDYTVNNVSSNKRLNVKPSAIGFTFDGWYVGEASSETTVIRTPSADTQTIELTAHWVPTAYTIKFEAQDGSKATTKKPANLTAWSAILPTPADRAGYEFLGWFPTTEKDHAKYQEVENEFSTVTNSGGEYVFSVADFAKSGLYGNATSGYTLGSITLYGIWKSHPVYIEVDENEQGELSFYKKVEDGEEQISSDDLKVSINDEIRVEVKAPVGYEFKNLVLGDNKTQRDGLTTFTVSSRYVDSSTNTLKIKVNYTEKRFSIDYDTDGGRINDSSYAKIYTASNITTTDDSKKAKLPSTVVKNGYVFDGWIFASTAGDEVEDELAHLPVAEGESAYGAALYLLKPFALNGDGKTYRDVTLKAVWKAEESEVRLYNATYLSGEYTKPSDVPNADYYLINNEKVTDDIVTGAVIRIKSPVRDSFKFLGWATTRNGTVVYPATDYDASGRALPIEYTVSAHKDTNGNLLNRNNLYAVWHVADIDYVIMSASNNGSQYGGNGITMTAKSSRDYDSDSGIQLSYTWYKIYDGMYDQCVIEKDYLDKNENKLYVDAEGALVAYEDKNGNLFDAEKQPINALPEGAVKLTFKEFNEQSVGTACVVKKTFTDKSPTDEVSHKVSTVADCGMYICVVKVTAGENEGNDVAFGEIEITMSKAVYGGLTFADKKVTYNLSSRSSAIEVKQGDKSATLGTDGLKTFTLPDESKVVVTYRYFVGEGELREEITDLSQIRNVGIYHVVASFAFAVGGDKGNYEALEELEADLIIDADPLSALEFVFKHDGVKSELDFSGAYDGKAYGVDVEIKDKVDISANSQLVTELDDVAVEVKVYKVTDDGDEPVTGETVDAGTYYVEIVGLNGAASGNYVLGELPSTKKEYTITKMKYDVAGHVKFEDSEVDFDNETHAIEFTIDGEYELPSTVTFKYTTVYVAEDASFDADNSRKPNTVDDNNGGRYAGTYTVTVEFTDSASENYEELESKTATLTIKKAKFFEFYNKDGKDLLRDAGFVSASYAYKVSGKYNPYINGGMLNTTEDFALTYDYYLVNETTQERTMLGSGTHEQLLNAGSEENKGNLISRSGKYEIIAQIKYVSALYKNNFEEIPESERTITYVIRKVAVESVTVVWADDFDKVVKLGEAFDYDWIKAIKVKFAQENTEESGVATQADDDNTLTMTNRTDIALAGIKFEKKNNVEQTTFWHVGGFNVIVSFYGVEIEKAEVFTVKEEIRNVTLRYGTDGENFKTVGSDGLEMDGSNYSFRVYYSCTDESGATGTRWTAATIADGGLVLGSNALGVTEDYYTFAVEGGISIAMYKVISEATWEYSLDGNSWAAIPDGGLVYAGTAYQIRAKFNDDGEQTAPAKTDSGIEVLNVNTGSDGYVMEVGRSGNYKVTATCSFRVVPKVLEFDWDSSELKYNMFSRSPVATAKGIADADKDSITLSYEYFDKDGNKLASVDEVVKVGKYTAKIVLRGDATTRNNYTLTGSETAEQKFEIVQADVKMAEVYYSESNYGKNITFAGNSQLRLGALKADFGENTVVSGQFSFITNYQPATGEYETVDGTALASLIANVGDANVQYVYKPNDKNFKDKVGTVTLDVREQKAKTGAGALSVEFGKDAILFYLVDQKLDTYGIEVYRLYESAYQENGKWYGLRREVTNPIFRVDGYNGSLENYKITSQDLSSEKIVLRAIDGGNSGTLDVPVVDKTASGLEVFSTNHRTTYYVGETPDFSDMTFRVLFGQGEKPLEGLKIGTVKMKKVNGADVDAFTVTEAGTFTVTFSYFNVSKDVTFTAQPKENLEQHIVKPTTTILTWKGDDIRLDPPQLTFTVDGKTYGQNELEGVKVTVTIKQGENIATLAREGEYQVIYSFEVTNPRFETPSTIPLKVTVTKNPYKVEFTKPEIKSAFYTGNPITIPKITIDGTVKDATAGDNPVPSSYVEISYKINGKDAVSDRDWQRVNADEYKVDITVKVKAYNGHSEYTAGTDSYTYTIKQAENDHANVNIALPDNGIVLLGAGANFNFDVTADFGEDTAVLKYSRTRDGVYTTDKPDAIGTWFVKAEIPETSNYKRAEKIESFEVRTADITSESGSVSGGHGIGEGWKLEIKQMESGDVSKVSISKQNVLDGYTVVLKNDQDVQISGEGEYTVRVKLSDSLSGRTDLKVFFKDASGKTTERKASVKDGFVEFKTSEFGTFIITSAVAEAKSPTGLIAGVSVLGVIAVGLIIACVIVFLKKRKGA